MADGRAAGQRPIAVEPLMDVARGRRGGLHGQPAARRQRAVHDRHGDQDAFVGRGWCPDAQAQAVSQGRPGWRAPGPRCGLRPHRLRCRPVRREVSLYFLLCRQRWKLRPLPPAQLLDPIIVPLHQRRVAGVAGTVLAWVVAGVVAADQAPARIPRCGSGHCGAAGWRGRKARPQAPSRSRRAPGAGAPAPSGPDLPRSGPHTGRARSGPAGAIPG